MADAGEDVVYLSASELVSAYRAKRLSPVEVTQAILDRIDAVNDKVNAFCLVDADSALASAGASEDRWVKGEPCGLVDGVPTTIKDLALTRGWPTLRGSKAIAPEQDWDEDAPVVARLREHGAVLLGKTTTPEFGWKAVTDCALTGITRNPWNVAMTPGGSSGGAAAATALGMGALHTGSDGGGSIRIPAGFTGVFGHKPSFGRVPAAPLSPFGTVSHIGPITRTVQDAALMLNVISLPDARDWFAMPYDGRDYRVGLEDGVRGLDIAFSIDLGYAKVDPEIAELVSSAALVFAELGARIHAVDPDINDPANCFRKHWYTGAACLMQSFDEQQRAEMDPGLREVASEGAGYPLLDYMAAVSERGELGTRMRQFHETYDLLLTPTLPIPAFAAGQELSDSASQERWPDWTPFSFPFNLTQQPAATVPCGLTSDGLPAGLQIVGPMHNDALVLRAARAFESARPFIMPGDPKGNV